MWWSMLLAIESLVAEEADRRVAIWLRVRLGGERMTTVAGDYGYRDGSGVHRVVQRLEKKAEDDQALARRLKALAKHVSSVKSCPRFFLNCSSSMSASVCIPLLQHQRCTDEPREGHST